MSEELTALKNRLKSEDLDEKRQAAEEFMYNEQDSEAIKLLSGLLEDTDKGVRNAAAMALKFSPDLKFVAECIVHLVASKDIAVRNLAGDILLNCGSDAVQPMEEYLSQTDNDGIKFIIDLFSLIQDDSVAETILQILKVNTDENVILACTEALGSLKYEKAIEDLITTYWMSEFYRPTVIEALGKIGSQKALDFFFDNYEEADELTKFSIIESLGLIGDQKTFFFLISQLNMQNQTITWPIIESIYLLKEKFGFDAPFDESMKNAIIDTILNGDAKYKISAVGLISEFNDKHLLTASLKIYGTDSQLDYEIRKRLVEDTNLVFPMFAKILHDNDYYPKGLLSLLNILIEEDPNQNFDKLGQLELRSLCDSITNFIKDPDEEVRKSAMELLFLIQPESAMLFLDSMKTDTNIWNRLRLIELLQTRKEAEAKEVLEYLADDQEEMVSFQAKEALEQNISTELN